MNELDVAKMIRDRVNLDLEAEALGFDAVYTGAGPVLTTESTLTWKDVRKARRLLRRAGCGKCLGAGRYLATTQLLRRLDPDLPPSKEQIEITLRPLRLDELEEIAFELSMNPNYQKILLEVVCDCPAGFRIRFDRILREVEEGRL